MSETLQQRIIEGALFASDRPLTVNELCQLFTEEEKPSTAQVKAILTELTKTYAQRGIQLHTLASGYTFRIAADLAPWVSRLWEHKPQKYSRALLETLAVIAYRQPVTRGDIEQIRGVTVSAGTIKTLLDREWIRIVGHREVPGRPELMATTPNFLDYFGLRTLEELPALICAKEIEPGEQLSLLEIKTAEASALTLTAASSSQVSQESQ